MRDGHAVGKREPAEQRPCLTSGRVVHQEASRSAVLHDLEHAGLERADPAGREACRRVREIHLAVVRDVQIVRVADGGSVRPIGEQAHAAVGRDREQPSTGVHHVQRSLAVERHAERPAAGGRPVLG